ncbi:polyunsaturated fatty acid 5-lipoxygenase-like isoform X2 [Centruroides vittatus]|uniref:polyunsaturated fatty acid 5-lipoxygenase-like isoform X2 n=1 Tax=Centruroides vittatus TaxID=120091 RepID=UPI00350FD110
MGNSISNLKSDYIIEIKTADRRNNVGSDTIIWLILYDERGFKTDAIKLNASFKSENQICILHVSCPLNFDNVEKIEIWRNSYGLEDILYLEYLTVEKKNEKKFWFPLHRWISSQRRYYFRENDCCLPQYELSLTQRNEELDDKRKLYEYTEHIEGGPLQWKLDPDLKKEKLYNMLEMTSGKWQTIEEIKSFLRKNYLEPSCVNRWDDDTWFAMQRLQGINPVSIKLCRELPENFAADDKELEPFLEDLSLREALENKRIFIIDYKIMKNLPCKDDKLVCAPIALFYVNHDGEIRPIAIQLFQDRTVDNPVFFPSDPPYTWLLAKMYFNNADALYHRACLSIGRTHLLMESLWISINRNLSPSHPIYKLMAPHFKYLLSINKLMLEKLLVMGGWIDRVTTIGVRGLSHLIARRFSNWKFEEINIPKEIESRGVNDPGVLPYYPYRDDATALYDSIFDYVGKIVKNHYDYPEKISQDIELQNWRKELVREKKDGGCQLQGVPGTENGFGSRLQITDTITSIIANCTIFHAAVDIPQYEECAFVPNYPLLLMGPIPRSKSALSESEIVEQLPNVCTIKEIINVVKILSGDNKSRLGYSKSVYLLQENDISAHKEFLEELSYLINSFKKRNEYRKYAYTWMNPEVIPDHIIA